MVRPDLCDKAQIEVPGEAQTGVYTAQNVMPWETQTDILRLNMLSQWRHRAVCLGSTCRAIEGPDRCI